MKLISILCLGLWMAAQVIDYTYSYYQGYYETENSLFDFCDLMWLLFGVISFFGILSLLIFSLVQKRHRLWMAYVLMVIFIPFFIPKAILPSPGDMMAYGLKNRIMHDYTLEDLRHFARDVNDAGILKGNGIDHGNISDLADPQKETFEQLAKKYPFMHWMDDGQTFRGPSIFDYGGQIWVEWGGPLIGHRGCSISIDGRRNNPDIEAGSDVIEVTLPVSDDIYFFYGM